MSKFIIAVLILVGVSAILADDKLPTVIDSSNIDSVFKSVNRSSPLNRPDSGVFGVDVSSWIGEDTWTCLKNAGYDVAIVRNFQSNCQVDPNG